MPNLNTIEIRAAVESGPFNGNNKLKLESNKATLLEKEKNKEGHKNILRLYRSTIKVISPIAKRSDAAPGVREIKLKVAVSPQDTPDLHIHEFALSADKKPGSWEVRVSIKNSKNDKSALALEYEIPTTELFIDIVKGILKEVLDWYCQEYYVSDLDKFPMRLAKRKFSAKQQEEVLISGEFPQEISLN
ncbi:hypothetical protein ACFL6Y_10390 [Elusimicrobiota bacterium]